MVDSNRRRDDDRGSSRDRDRGGDDRRRDDRGSSRDERGSRDDRSSRDEPRGRSDDRGSSRGRDDDRGSRGRSDDRDSGRGRSSGSSSRFEYHGRTADETKARASMGANDFDKIVRDGVKMYKVRSGENRIRILPPTWPKPKHFGFDVFVHYGVGADRGSYLDLQKMKGEPDPISEERERARADRSPDEDYIKELDSKRRVGIWLVDRDDEKEGVQFWAMPWTVDRDIVSVSVDRDTGEVLPIDHPEEGYDVIFDKTGEKDRTKYTGVNITRRSSKLGKPEWLDYAMDNPIPDVLMYYDYDTIAKAFGAKGEQRDRSDRGDDRRDSRDSRAPEREERGSSRSDDRGGRSREREEPSRREEPATPTWKEIHEMTAAELDDLVEAERLPIDPRKAKDDEDLADWICEEMKISKDEPPSRERRRDDGGDAEDKLAKMRNRRRED